MMMVVYVLIALWIVKVIFPILPWPKMWRAVTNYQAWARDARDRGLDDRTAFEEMQFRMALASVRRVASDAVIADPARWRDILTETITAEGESLAVSYRFIAFNFLKASKDWLPEDILYDDALEAIRPHRPDYSRLKIAPETLSDFLAATTIRD